MDPDADADGIHCGATVTLFSYRWMRPLLDDGRVCAARAPLATFVVESGGHPQHAEHHVRSGQELRAAAEILRPVEARHSAKSTRVSGLRVAPKTQCPCASVAIKVRLEESTVDPRDAMFCPKAILQGRIDGRGTGPEIDDL